MPSYVIVQKRRQKLSDSPSEINSWTDETGSQGHAGFDQYKSNSSRLAFPWLKTEPSRNLSSEDWPSLSKICEGNHESVYTRNLIRRVPMEDRTPANYSCPTTSQSVQQPLQSNHKSASYQDLRRSQDELMSQSGLQSNTRFDPATFSSFPVPTNFYTGHVTLSSIPTTACAATPNSIIHESTAASYVSAATSLDTTGIEKSTKPIKMCSVCGLEASGMYFGALVCLPCKSFFIRCTKDADTANNLKCQGDINCGKRGPCQQRCQYCRYQQCLAAGMCRKEKPEVVLPAEGQSLCKVCGDIANGVHFGVSTCEGCKKFFRRGLKEASIYTCKGDKTCTITPRSRNTCRYCRYDKCISVGMSRNAIKMGRPRKSLELASPEDLEHRERAAFKSGNTEEDIHLHKYEATQLEIASKVDTGAVTFSSSFSSFDLPAPSAVKRDRSRLSSFSDTEGAISPNIQRQDISSLQFTCGNSTFFSPTVSVPVSPHSVLSPIAHPLITNSNRNAQVSQAPANNNHCTRVPQPLPMISSQDINVTHPSCTLPGNDISNAMYRSINRPALLPQTYLKQQDEPNFHKNELPYKKPHDTECKEITEEDLNEIMGLTARTCTDTHLQKHRVDNEEPQKRDLNYLSPSVSHRFSSVQLQNSIKSPASSNSDFSNSSPDWSENYGYEVSSPFGLSSETGEFDIACHLDVMATRHSKKFPDEHIFTNVKSIYDVHKAYLNLSDDHLHVLSSSNSNNVVEQLFDTVFKKTEDRNNFLSHPIQAQYTRTPGGDVRTRSSDVRTSTDCKQQSLACSKRKDFEDDYDHTRSSCCDHESLTKGLQSNMSHLQHLIDLSYWKYEKPQQPVELNDSLEHLLKEIEVNYIEMCESVDEAKVLPRIHSKNANLDLNWSVTAPHSLQWVHIKKRIIRNSIVHTAFTKKIPGFITLSEEDQSLLCKLGCFQISFVQACQKFFDPEKRNFKFFWNWQIPPDHPFYVIKLELLRIGEALHKLHLDDVEAGTFCALIINAADYREIKEPERIKPWHDNLICALEAYVCEKYGKETNRMSHLLSFIPHCRHIGFWYRNILKFLKLEISDDDIHAEFNKLNVKEKETC